MPVIDRSATDADLSARLAALKTSGRSNSDHDAQTVHAAAGGLPKTSQDQLNPGTHTGRVLADDFPGGQDCTDSHTGSAAGEQASVQASVDAVPNDGAPARKEDGRGQIRSGAHTGTAATGGQPAATDASAPMTLTLLADPFLSLAADVLDDTETVRIADENRLRQLTRTETDKDGEQRGFGLDLTHPAVASLAAMVRTMKCDSQVVEALTGEKPRKAKGCCLEHDAERHLISVFRASPLYPWMAAQIGIGDKQGARLLGAIGDPYIRPELVRKKDGEVVAIEPSRPRKVSELWALAGLHVIKVPVSGHFSVDAHSSHAVDGQASSGGQGASGTQSSPAASREGGGPGHCGTETHRTHAGVAPKRQRGQRSNWDDTIKMRAYLVAESCMKNKESPYRKVYDATRARYADAVHETECVRCGPKGSPAQAGTALSDGHKHARALRAVAKEVLRDLWTEAKRIHGAIETR